MGLNLFYNISFTKFIYNQNILKSGYMLFWPTIYLLLLIVNLKYFYYKIIIKISIYRNYVSNSYFNSQYLWWVKSTYNFVIKKFIIDSHLLISLDTEGALHHLHPNPSAREFVPRSTSNINPSSNLKLNTSFHEFHPNKARPSDLSPQVFLTNYFFFKNNLMK